MQHCARFSVILLASKQAHLHTGGAWERNNPLRGLRNQQFILASSRCAASGSCSMRILPGLYGVSVSAFNQAVRRNRARFPADFMFRLTAEEWGRL